jgi:hypothetical protein
MNEAQEPSNSRYDTPEYIRTLTKLLIVSFPLPPIYFPPLRLKYSSSHSVIIKHQFIIFTYDLIEQFIQPYETNCLSLKYDTCEVSTFEGTHL